jgi:hypothetical protein
MLSYVKYKRRGGISYNVWLRGHVPACRGSMEPRQAGTWPRWLLHVSAVACHHQGAIESC